MADPNGVRIAMRWTTMLVTTSTVLAGLGCSEKTGVLTPAQQQRIDSEGLVRRADDLVFRFTHDAGRRGVGWEDRKASILVTRQSVIIHKNEKLGLEITPRTRRYGAVRRDGNRVRISTGSGGATESWSFVPPSDPAGWAADIRAVMNSTRKRRLRGAASSAAKCRCG
jgi:hypothetical protein